MKNFDLGLSGCKLLLIENNIVRKYSKNSKYNSRLISQAKKQINFHNTNLKFVKTPKVLKIEENNLAYFDMEYCYGYNYDQFFSNCSILDNEKILNYLFEYIDFHIKNSTKYDYIISKNLFTNKLSSLHYKSDYKNIIDFIISNYDLLNIDNISLSNCHGDLTFSNMLFSKNCLYLIDFLDSFIDSFYIDFAKLKQDLYYHWILKINDESSSRIYQIFDYFWYKIYERYAIYINTSAFDLFDFINLLRIEPYVSNKNKTILHECLSKHKFYVNFNRTNGRTII